MLILKIYLLLFFGYAKASSFYVSGCTIFDSKFEQIANYPGQFCIFNGDGSYVSTKPIDGQVTLHGSTGGKVWSKDFFAHHQIKSNTDGGYVFLSSEIVKYQEKYCRSDIIFIAGVDGNIIRSWKFFDNADEIKSLLKATPELAKTWLWSASWFSYTFPALHYEVSHINSIYEVPDNANAKKIAAFKKGNYILNSSYGFVFILSRDLKKILWFKEYSNFFHASRLHDVQVLPNGNILAYVNKVDQKRESYLVEYNSLTGVPVWKYGGTSSQHFFSGFSGGVQVLNNGNILFSELTDLDVGDDFKQAKVKVINRAGVVISDKKLLINGQNAPIQEIKEVSVGKFLKYNKTPI
jgi:hypothetical protein